MRNWTAEDMPDQSGRTVVITGANSGLGLHSAYALAAKGAHLLLACRSPERGARAVAQVRTTAPRAKVELVRLDLGDLASVRVAAADIRERAGDRVHVLMNNAGVFCPPLGRTADGFETQMGVNHLGHAALTWLLMPALRQSPDARVITLSSLAHRRTTLRLDDLNYERRRYNAFAGYGEAKLANLMFAQELDRRLSAADLDVRSLAAHPGLTDTELGANGGRARKNKVLELGVNLFNKVATMRPERGVLSQLYAATAPEVRGGQYYGPAGAGEVWGGPGLAACSPESQDLAVAARLYELSGELTGIAPDPA
ncbi:oxidoreductase [Crossiella sp. CA198]|uniref:oxidoreductase n=1 Tax=Crossiella sp. CA198 TaxID=3455607 RepID=UPI003F8D769E